MIDPSGVRVTGPLSTCAAGFAAELRRQGYTPGSAIHRLRLLAHLSRWLAEEGLDLHRLSPVEAERFLEARRASGYSNYLSSKSLTRGATHSYLSAACPAPKGFPGAVFPFARASFAFAGGRRLAKVLVRSCRVG